MICNLPLNSVSFGQVGAALLRELSKQKKEVQILPIGNLDISAQKSDEKFEKWLVERISKTYEELDFTDQAVRLWHIQGSACQPSLDCSLLTFHETDELTLSEINLLQQYSRVLVTSKFTQEVFESYGVKAEYCGLGLDEHNFYPVKRQRMEGTTVFGLCGKLENRKNTLRILKLWALKFGNNPNFQLDCLIENPFIKKEDQESLVKQTLEKDYWNINFFSRFPQNMLVNDFMNHVDINLTGLSGGEGFNLPLFNSLALGKWGVALNAHVHKDYCNTENCILIEPNGKKPAHDGVFFKEGGRFNQGRFFDFSNDDAISAMEEAAKKVGIVNKAGIALKKDFNFKKTINKIYGEPLEIL